VTRWVLLRGLSREQAHWGDFPQTLAYARAPGDSVLCLDLPGAGALCDQPSPLRVEAMVQACRAQLSALTVAAPGLPPIPTVLVGLSMGGMVATAWAQAWPLELAGLVLVNSSARRFSPALQRLRWAALPALLGLLWAQLRGDAAAQERAVLRLTSAQPQHHGAALAAWCAVRQARPVALRNVLRQLLAAARYRGPAQPPGVPVLVACSAADRLVSPTCSVRLAQRWHAAICQHPWAGHDLPLDDGPWLATRIAQWWQAQQGDDAARRGHGADQVQPASLR